MQSVIWDTREAQAQCQLYRGTLSHGATALVLNFSLGLLEQPDMQHCAASQKT